MAISKALLKARELNDRALAARDNRASAVFRGATAHLELAPAFDGLHPQSLGVASVRPADLPPAINLILPQLSLTAIFAGTRTAIEFAVMLSSRLQRPLRIIALTGGLTQRRVRKVRAYLDQEFGDLAGAITTVLSATDLPQATIGRHDLWIATHWTTAHSLDVAARLQVVDPADVIYLVQDYEPGFNPWSTDFAVSRATYHAGFRTVVNSRPLYDYLTAAEKVDFDPRLVFRPRLDLDRLEQSADERRRQPSAPASVLFYARPDKPRNLFAIGMSALALTAIRESGSGRELTIRTAGAHHAVPRPGPLGQIDVLGKVPWAHYFKVLASSDVVLSLQHSPHPSHPPLDAVVSGGWAVTNDMDSTRRGLHPRLIACPPDPRELSSALAVALAEVRDDPRPADFSPELLGKLGADVNDVMDALVDDVSR